MLGLTTSPSEKVILLIYITLLKLLLNSNHNALYQSLLLPSSCLSLLDRKEDFRSLYKANLLHFSQEQVQFLIVAYVVY